MNIYVSGLYAGTPQTVNIYAYNGDGISVKASPSLTFTLSSGWNALDLTPLIHLMDNVGFVKFRLVASQNWVDISEAWVTAKSAKGIDDWTMSIVPGRIDFGEIQTGTYPVKDLSISNTGTGVLRIKQIVSSGSPFHIAADYCSGRVLNASDFCNLSIRFVPESGNTYSGSISISSNDIDNPLVNVPVTGTSPLGVVLSGVVTDEDTGLPLSGVHVTIRQPRHIEQTGNDYMYIRRCQEFDSGITPDSITSNEFTSSNLSAIQANDNIKLTYYCNKASYEYYKVRNPINSSDSFRLIWNGTAGSFWTDKLGQSFIPSKTGALTKVSLNLVKPSFNITGFVKVYLKSMLEGEKETVIAESEPFNFASMPSYTGMWVDFPFLNPVTINSGQKYFLELHGDGCYTLCCSLSPPKLAWSNDQRDTYSSGRGYYQESTQWIENTWSFLFKTFINDQIDQQYDPGYKEMSYSLAFTCSFPAFELYVYNQTTGNWDYKEKCSFWNEQAGELELGFDDVTIDKTVTSDTANYYDADGWLTFRVFKEDDSYPNMATDYVGVSFLRTLTAVTDNDGKYTISNLMPTEYSMDLQKNAYIPLKLNGFFAQERTYTVSAKLKKAPLLSITITTPGSNSVITTPSLYVQGKVTNNAEVSVNGSPAYVFPDGFYSANIVLTEGVNTITASAVDQYGQTVSNTISVTLNTKGVITGTVSDLFTELPLQSVTVSVTDSMNSTLTATTGSDGRYTLTGIAAGYFVGSITKNGYLTSNISGNMIANTTKTIDIFLTTALPVISNVNVNNITTSSAIISWTTNIPSGKSSFCTALSGPTAADGKTICSSFQQVGFNSLKPNTIYHFMITSIYHGYTASSGDQTFTTLSLPSPSISSISVSNITFNSAVVTWTTDQPTSTVVEYGTTTTYGSSISDSALTTDHSIQIPNLNSGIVYHFRIIATNSFGISSSSADNTFTTLSPITITIGSPVNNETINRPEVIVKGTITNSTASETGVTVNGIVATVYGSQFIANHVPLTEGQNTITVTATDIAGNTAVASINVNAVTTGNYIRITSNIESGISPLQVLLRIDGSFSVTETNISVSGPGPVEFLPGTLVDEYEVRITTEGIYYFTATVTGTDNIFYEDTVAVVVLNKTQLDTLLKAKWEGMKGALMSGDIEASLNYLVYEIRDTYREMFNQFGLAKVTSILSRNTDFKLSVNYGRYSECGAIKTEDDGTPYSYPVRFVLDEKGIWKIMGF